MMPRSSFLVTACIGIGIALGAAPCRAGIVLKVSDVSVDRSQLPKLVLVPILAISDEIDLKVSGFNLNFDIGGDGQGPLPLGVSLPAPLPDLDRIIAQGGEANARNWAVQTVDATDASLVESDVFIIGNSPTLATDIPILGDPIQLTGGAVLFHLALQVSPTVGDRIDIAMPSELGALPLLTGSLGNALAVSYLAGSISITSIPEPCSIALAAMALAWVGASARRRESVGNPRLAPNATNFVNRTR